MTKWRCIVLAAAFSAASGVFAIETGDCFWRVRCNADGRWWAVAPDGRETFLRGVDHATYDGHRCEALNTNPYRDEMAKRFSSRAAWAEQTVKRLKSWGFNALGANSSVELHGRGLAYCEFLGIGEAFCKKGGDCALGAAEGVPGTAFPNVFNPDFAKFCDEYAARRCASLKDDTSLIGYFFDNELAWYGRGGPATGLYEAAGKPPAPEEAKIEFLRLAARRYFETVSAAIRRYDPNHLLLGCRFAGLDTAHRVVWEEAGKVCDVVTFNQYPWADLDENVVYVNRSSSVKAADAFAERYSWVNKPLMVTEWGFVGLDSGLPCTGGYGQRFRTQTERAQAVELFADTLVALPFMVGYDYFMWVDEPALGISKMFPENSNYGLVNERGEPYSELITIFSRIHRSADAAHAVGKVPAAVQIDAAAKERISIFSYKAIESSVKAKFSRKGDAYMLRTASGLLLRGRVGGQHALDSIAADGVECGPLTFMVYHGDWQDIDCVESVEWFHEIGTLRISGVWSHGRKAFRIMCDIVPFVDKPWFGCNVVSVDNIGLEIMHDVSVWLRQYSPWARDSAGSNAVKQVPDLWKSPASGVWIRASDGAWCGAATFARTVKTFNYWVSGDGGSHPDAAFCEAKPLDLLPGTSWKPEGRAWMVAAAGRCGFDGWTGFLDDFTIWRHR